MKYPPKTKRVTFEGRRYAVIHSDERLFVNGQEFLFVIDHNDMVMRIHPVVPDFMFNGFVQAAANSDASHYDVAGDVGKECDKVILQNGRS